MVTSTPSQTAPTDSSSLDLPSPTNTVNSSHPESPRNKRALLVAIRHITRKAKFKFGDLPDLRLSHRDATALRDFLISSRGYHPDDITLMMDDKHIKEHLWPTRDRILHQIDELARNAPDDCHFFFYFSGHGLEEDGGDRANKRADGQDDEIVCADAKPILDHTLHDRLVTPLQSVRGSNLFALFDCCHSETLLDLQSGSRPNIYSRRWMFGRDQLFRALVTIVIKLFALSKASRDKCPNATRPPRRASTKWCPPEPEIREVGQAGVICLSACRDGQLAHDDCGRKLTFTKCFLDAMMERPNITWIELRDTLKERISDIRRRYEEVCLQDSDSDSSLSHGTWAQEPRYCTSSHIDLSGEVSF